MSDYTMVVDDPSHFPSLSKTLVFNTILFRFKLGFYLPSISMLCLSLEYNLINGILRNSCYVLAILML